MLTLCVLLWLILLRGQSNLKLPLRLLRIAVLLDFGDNAAEFVVIEDVGDGVADLLHGDAQAARLLVGTRARLIGREADARDGRERPVE